MIKSFGKLPSGKRLERIIESSNYSDGSFQNIAPTQMLAEGTTYPKMIKEFFFEKGIDRAPQAPIPSVKTDLISMTRDEPAIVWFGHSSYLLVVEGKRILVDPVFSERASPWQFVGTKGFEFTNSYSIDDFPEIDLLILTHDHYDHLDYNSILKLRSKVRVCCTALGVGEHLAYWGMGEWSIKEFDWRESSQVLPGIELTATPARHFSGRGFKRNQSLWTSFVLKTTDYKIFIGGDSGYDDSFRQIGEKLGPFHLAVLECGQYNERWPLIHMMPEQTVQAAVDLKADVLLPVHWGKFNLSLHPWKEPITRASAHAGKLQLKITTPRIGEVVKLNDVPAENRWWR